MIEMAYSYKGSISFGLVYIPITLYTAITDTAISFKLLEKKTKSRVKYKKTCMDCKDKEIGNQDIVKGYEYEEGKYVIFSEEDFEKIKSPKDKTIQIEQFIQVEEIDPIYYDKSYYVVPTGGEKAFVLLLKAMEQENKAGLANTLFFEAQIKKNPCKDLEEKLQKQEVEMAKLLITQMSASFQPKKYKDEYREKLERAIEKKIQGEEIVSSKEASEPTVSDLMEALQASLESIPKSKKNVVLPKKKDRPRANA